MVMLLVNVVMPLINTFSVAHKIPLQFKVDSSGMVSRVVELFHRRGLKGVPKIKYVIHVTSSHI